jgi:predicted MFS family arabinose efflux permease
VTRALTFLFAVAGGVAVGNLYWAQPLLEFIARDLHASTSTAGWLVTATQIGYALGIVIIVPLGDTHDRRRLIPIMMTGAAIALTACALAPSMGVLLVAIGALGLTTVSGQILIPLAGDLADEQDRGRVVGTVLSGVLSGILVSRTLSGLVAGAFGWRAIFGFAAVLALVFAVLLYRALPTVPPRVHLPYRALLASVVRAVADERAVRWTLVLGAIAFASFTLFWTSLTFLLSAPPFSYSVTVIGLFGLVGLAGALTAQRAGRLHDRGWSIPATGVGWVLLIVSFALARLGSDSVPWLVVGVLVLDIAIQGLNVLNQTRLFSLAPQARSRLNTAFVASIFVGGAIGSTLATVLWSVDGWTAVTTAGGVLGVIGLLVWAVGRRHALVISGPARPTGS